ncbi:NUDIX hydrolase [[Bacillus] enclensis]|uniref:NUDIX hydrolase n=1 Tax=[Bacillus] enclensis TaxID=1402860 RepID=UPI0018DCD126|nr:NUDIX hydrolase [[Bacillus] enclensis]MBH9966213.1 NUDIX hydrolase [[Bacillus] enclensis]
MKRVDVTYMLLFDEPGEKVLLVKNTGKNGSYYTLPGGAAEPGETLEEAAIREVKEETGLDAEIRDIFSVGEGFFEDRGHHAVFFTFRGRITGGEITISRPEEIEEVRWMDAEDAEKYIHITRGTTGLLKGDASAPYLLRKRSDLPS